MRVLGTRGKITAAAAVIAVSVAAGALIEHFEGQTFTEEISTSARDVPRRSQYGDHFIDGRLNINAATEEELAALDGIGEKLAQRIAAYRSEHGVFEQTEGIMLVPGIGEKLYENIKDQITVR